MKKVVSYFIMVAMVLLFAASGSYADSSISASAFKAGDVVKIKGKIEPGQDLYLAIAQQDMFASKDTDRAFETKR